MSYGGGGVMLLSSSAAVTLPKEFDLEPTLQVLREVAVVQVGLAPCRRCRIILLTVER